MAKKNWEEIQNTLETTVPKLLESFIGSSEPSFRVRHSKIRFSALPRTSLPFSSTNPSQAAGSLSISPLSSQSISQQTRVTLSVQGKQSFSFIVGRSFLTYKR